MKKFPLLNNLINVISFFALVSCFLLLAISCSTLLQGLKLFDSSGYRELSENDLISNGFYAYVVPKGTEETLGWKRKISMFGPFDDHCTRSDSNFQDNNLKILYKDSQNVTLFGISISPVHVLWNDWENQEKVSVTSDWIFDQTAKYYITESGVLYLKVRDRFGIDAVITSSVDNFDLQNVINVISILEYVGPNIDDVRNPWEEICQ